MMASQTLLSRLNTRNYHNPLDGTLNRWANKLSITTSLCPSLRTLKAVDCGKKKTILVTKMKPSFGILQSTVNWLIPETFIPESFLFKWHWNEDWQIIEIPTPEQRLKCIHSISRIQCYGAALLVNLWCSPKESNKKGMGWMAIMWKST